MRGFIPLLALSVGAFAAPPLPAQEKPPVAAAAEAPPDIIKLGERSYRLTVPVSISNRGPFPFIIDTGAERSVVSRELAGYLKLVPGNGIRLFDFTGPADVPTVRVPTLSAGTLGLVELEAPQLLMDDIGAPGMLGIDALQGQRVILDFQTRRMMLRPARRHPNGRFVVPVSSRTGQLIVTEAWFNGQPIAVVIDTGSWLSVGNSAMLKLAKKPPPSYGDVAVVSVTGRTFSADYTVISDLKIGSMKFANFGLVFADAPPFERLGLADRPALILGMSSLKLFERVELDFVNREVGFTPRTRVDFRDPCHNPTMGCFSIGGG